MNFERNKQSLCLLGGRIPREPPDDDHDDDADNHHHKLFTPYPKDFLIHDFKQSQEIDSYSSSVSNSTDFDLF